MGISPRTVRRLLCVNPDQLCVDGTQTRKLHRLLDPYRAQIQELVERDFQPSQILKILHETFPELNVKRTTLNDYCIKLRAEGFEYTQLPPEIITTLSEDSILSPYVDKIDQMLGENKLLTVIFAEIKSEGYPGSYSLLQQYCRKIKPVTYRTKKADRKVKRRDLVTAVWSGKSEVSENDLAFIYDNYPVLAEIKSIITEFREAYSQKNVEAVQNWCNQYEQCKFPPICSFINGIRADADAFYNSMKYKYSNGLLEGSVNKLKAVKRSMFGRASYLLLRAKLLIANRV